MPKPLKDDMPSPIGLEVWIDCAKCTLGCLRGTVQDQHHLIIQSVLGNRRVSLSSVGRVSPHLVCPQKILRAESPLPDKLACLKPGSIWVSGSTRWADSWANRLICITESPRDGEVLFTVAVCAKKGSVPSVMFEGKADKDQFLVDARPLALFSSPTAEGYIFNEKLDVYVPDIFRTE